MQNKGVELASNEFVCLLHSDMYVPPKFDQIMLRQLQDHDFVTAWRVEPAVYPASADKVQMEFGRGVDMENSAENFNEEAFLAWVEKNEKSSKGRGQHRTCFPWMTTKTLFQTLGGVDQLFAKYLVDDDDFYLRIAMNGHSYWQTFETAVYHMPSKTTKLKNDTFTDGDDEWQIQHNKSTRNFIRKWHSHQMRAYTESMVLNPIYPRDVGFIIENCNPEMLYHLEPWCSTIYVDSKLIDPYVTEEQKNTKYDLKQRVLPYDNEKNNEVLVKFDAQKFEAEQYSFIQMLNDVLSDSGEEGEMQHDIFDITISKMATYETQNIIANTGNDPRFI